MPVCFVSAKTGAGVAELLDVLVKLTPEPDRGQSAALLQGRAARRPANSVPSRTRRSTCSRTCSRSSSTRSSASSACSACTRARSPRDTQLFVGDSRKPFKVGHLFLLQGGKNVEIDRAVPGDIVAVAKVDEIDFDAVLHDSHDEDQIHLRPLEFPVPMHGVAITPKKRGDEQRISDVLHRMIAEDPTLVIEHDATTNETVLRALGELHLRSILERMAAQFKLEIETRPPRIPYRETITAQAEGHHRHKKQTGGAGQFGEVLLRVEPLGRGAGFEFVDARRAA